MATAATKFRIDVSIHNLLQDSNGQKPRAAEPKGLTLPVPVFPHETDLPRHLRLLASFLAAAGLVGCVF